jgi:hypothetical protein
VVDLFHNNAGCKLPCWWGFTPEKTLWTTVRDYFNSHAGVFSEKLFLPDQQSGVIYGHFSIEKYNFQAGAFFFVEGGTVNVIRVFSNTYWPPDFVKFGDPFFMGITALNRGHEHHLSMSF